MQTKFLDGKVVRTIKFIKSGGRVVSKAYAPVGSGIPILFEGVGDDENQARHSVINKIQEVRLAEAK